MSLKGLDRRIGKMLLEARNDFRPDPFTLDGIESAVVYIPKGIGDGMAVFPAIRALLERSVARLIIVASPANAMVFEPLHGVEVVTVPHERAYRAIVRLGRELRAELGRVDLCIEATSRDNSGSIRFVGALRARMNLQLSGSRMKCYAPFSARAVQMYFERDLPVPWCWAALMQDAGIAEVEGKFELPLPPGVEEEVDAWLDGRGEFIVLNLDGSTPDKWLSLERGEMVAQCLEQRYGLPILVICSPSGEAKAAALAQRLKFVTLPALPRTIHHSAALIARAALVVTPDTSVVHIASAFDRPVIGIYRRANGHWIPLSTMSATIVTEGEVEKLSERALVQAMDEIGPLPPVRSVGGPDAVRLGPDV
ncbi:glycosyltransferase family 9 protein [Halotalea alkalilenta]|uniref:Glycosyl transferase n=1 Tax=Halotalea alkalilenta TaxID=376489 RepID=A0A172YI80_9GAMM|nr:glycosyltransferase family 9 protein [Halotalea alkalilenta]ANF58928.1 hypothetical protein A5892_16845 [Halotalea alkalilenta]